MLYARPMLVSGMLSVLLGCSARGDSAQNPPIHPVSPAVHAIGGGPPPARTGPNPARRYPTIPPLQKPTDETEATPRFTPQLSQAPSTVVPAAGRRGIPSPPSAMALVRPSETAFNSASNNVPLGPLPREDIGQPIRDLGRYGSCHVPPTAHVRVDVLVYEGAALGVEVVSTPANPLLERCIAGLVRHIQWKRQPFVVRTTVDVGD